MSLLQVFVHKILINVHQIFPEKRTNISMSSLLPIESYHQALIDYSSSTIEKPTILSNKRGKVADVTLHSSTNSPLTTEKPTILSNKLGKVAAMTMANEAPSKAPGRKVEGMTDDTQSRAQGRMVGIFLNDKPEPCYYLGRRPKSVGLVFVHDKPERCCYLSHRPKPVTLSVLNHK